MTFIRSQPDIASPLISGRLAWNACKTLWCFIAACACMSSPLVFAGLSKDAVGTASAQVLKLGAGAKAAGMGNAYAAMADDASAVYWNPGGIADAGKESASLMHAILMEDISYDWLAYVRPLGFGTIGAGIQRLSYGEMAGTDETGLEAGNFTPSETVGTLAYGFWTGNLGFGAGLKYITGKIQRSAEAVAADIGIKYGTSRKEGVSIGAVIQNLGGKMKYVSQSDPLPLNLKIGTAYRPDGRWTIAADADFPSDNTVVLGMGIEYGIKTEDGLKVAGRTGYNSRAKDLNGLAGFTASAGGSYEWFSLDYAFVPFGAMGNTHRISISIDF